MRRHPALHDLSRDHHVLLLHARRLRGEDRRLSALQERQPFLRYAEGVLRHHLAEEQELVDLLDPLLRDAVLRDHDAVLRACSAAAVADEEGLRAVGEALRVHARFHEDTVFPAAEALGQARLRDAAEALQALRRRLRPGSVGPGAAEECYL